MMVKHDLFVGLATLDLIYLAQGPPQANQKIVAQDTTFAAGGPATNAAVTFAYLEGQARLLTALGSHPMANLIRADLDQWSVEIVDLTPEYTQSPPVSSIIVTATTGERAVVSLNAQRIQANCDPCPAQILHDVDIVLIDGHQMAMGATIAQQAQAQGIPVVLDGGSWKPGLETVLPFVDYAICSADFYPPGCQTQEAVVAYLRAVRPSEHSTPSPPQIAITQGHEPILFFSGSGQGRVEVPQIQPIDTLGAGDIFHGAFCAFILQSDFAQALSQAGQIAAQACQSFGTRHWLTKT
jgi:sugar/nucleoside kinase (ribokinase family)